MFDNGSEILRFDCHLHTVSDKEFKYDGEDDKFISNYVDKLKSEGIGVGVITNHNKFDYEQYKALKKAANKSGIFILPGVELSVKEGASSVHMLVVFSPTEWISNGVDHISRMVGSMFLGIDDPGNENTCTENDMLTVIHVIIVDQPEDDLDNQVIYEELIQTIKKEKEDMQFIFATHNANIPVLGDAERVITVQHNDDESIKLKCGTIDSEETHSDIVNIMEGGTEAFKKRNEIYCAWS